LKNQKYTATTFAGLEEVLAKELTELGASDVEPGRRCVYFSGDRTLLYRVNYCLRTALRVLVPVDSFRIRSVDDLYRQTKRIEWEDYLFIDQTFAIQNTVFSDLFRNTMFASLKAKDAIVDRFREQFGKRPSVDAENPDIWINLHIAGDVCTFSLDSSGQPLNKRGYRVGRHEAPINEVLAAGLLKLSEWDGKTDLVDPMCGSGTIAIEAAMLVGGIRPGDIRKEFAFQKWPDYKKDIFTAIQDEKTSGKPECKIFASDISRQNINSAYQNAEAAGVSKLIDFKIADFKTLEVPSVKKILLFNPPYGERIVPEDARFYEMIGSRLKQYYTNTTAWIISTPACLKSIGLKPSQKIPLFNGSLECSFRRYDLYEGSKKKNGPEHKLT
jgi:putative N6-adenine-specific DNA methylase